MIYWSKINYDELITATMVDQHSNTAVAASYPLHSRASWNPVAQVYVVEPLQ